MAAKLGLEAGADAECIVAKAIRDGGIDAAIDHEKQLMYSKETADIYSTQEPQARGVFTTSAPTLIGP